jgi:hypothetical protein
MEKEKTRYNDEELQEFKEIILKKMEIAKDEFKTIQTNLKDGRKSQPIGCASIEVHQKFGSCFGSHRKQNLRHLQNFRKIDSQRKIARRTPYNSDHRGQIEEIISLVELSFIPVENSEIYNSDSIDIAAFKHRSVH